jgi:hypothetical protein
MDVLGSRGVHVEVDDERTPDRMMDDEARLLVAFTAHRLLGSLARLEVTTGLEPPVEPPVEMEDDAATSDDDGRRRHMGQIGPLIEGVVEAVQFGQDDRFGPLLAVVSGGVAGHRGPEGVDVVITHRCPRSPTMVIAERVRPTLVGRSGRLPTLSVDPSALTFGGATPDAFAFPVGQRVFEAGLSYRTEIADRLCLAGLLVGDRVEHIWIDAPAGSVLAPGGSHGNVTS